MKKKLIWMVLLSIFLVIGGYYYFRSSEVSYLTTKIEQRDIIDRVLANGKIDASEVVDVGAQVSGQLKKLYVNLGDVVKKGDLLAEIDADDKENRLKAATFEVFKLKAQLVAKEANLDKLKKDYERFSILYRKGNVAKVDLEEVETALKIEQAEIDALKAEISKGEVEISTAKIDIGYTRIIAPIDGIVTSVVTKQGQTVVSAQQAVTIVVLKNLNTVTVKAEISEADIYRVKSGMSVYFTTLGDREIKNYGILRMIEPDTKTNTKISDQTASTSNNDEAVYYNGLFEVDNKDGRFLPSMTAEVSIIIKESKGVWSLPVTALKKENGKNYVLVLEDNCPKKRVVEVGINDRIYAEIISGLSEDDQVILGDSSENNQENLNRRRRAF